MTTSTPLVRLLLIVPLLAVAGSCVDSRRPLSDEKTSKIDGRLIGSWRDDNGGVWKVKRSADVPNALDVEQPDPNGPARMLAFTTTIKSKGYLSIKEDDGKDAGKKSAPAAYEIYQYTFVAADTVEVRGMTPEVILKAIAGKQIGGEIEVTPREAKPAGGASGKGKAAAEKTPVITAAPEDIARYLEKHADECYPAKTDLMLTFKRQK